MEHKKLHIIWRPIIFNCKWSFQCFLSFLSPWKEFCDSSIHHQPTSTISLRNNINSIQPQDDLLKNKHTEQEKKKGPDGGGVENISLCKMQREMRGIIRHPEISNCCSGCKTETSRKMGLWQKSWDPKWCCNQWTIDSGCPLFWRELFSDSQTGGKRGDSCSKGGALVKGA